MEMVALKNGSLEPRIVVAAAMMSVEGLWNGGITAMCHVVELVSRCKNPLSDIDPSSNEALKKLALLQGDGQPHDSIKNIVLSMAIGEGVHMTLGSPLKQD